MTMKPIVAPTKKVVGPETKSTMSRMNTGSAILAAQRIGQAHRLEHDGDDGPDQGPEGPVHRPAQADGRLVVIEARAVELGAPAVPGVADLGEVRRVGPRDDRHHHVGQGAEPVGHLQRLGQILAPRISRVARP